LDAHQIVEKAEQLLARRRAQNQQASVYHAAIEAKCEHLSVFGIDL